MVIPLRLSFSHAKIGNLTMRFLPFWPVEACTVQSREYTSSVRGFDLVAPPLPLFPPARFWVIAA